MARNRQRAKERRSRRSDAPAPHARDDAPTPLGHATPDVELAEAQMALGRPELAADGAERVPEPPEDEGRAGDDEAEGHVDYAGGDGPPSGAAGAGRADDSGDGEPEPEEAEGEHHAVVRVERVPIGKRLVSFLQGSWRELQRVQWPDRRQVMQATGVVIGFVIVAGAFLGVADFLAGKLVNLILK